MTLLHHLELHCGKTTGGFSELHTEFHVIQLPRGPVEGSATLATLGLSHHVMHSSSGGGRTFRMELVMLFRESEGRRNLPGVLHQAGMEALRQHHGFLRGDVIAPWGPLHDGATVEALYASVPAYFPESFHEYTPPGESQPIVLAWMVPITASEAAFVQRAGWQAFETELERQDPDLLDLHRSAIRLPR